MKYLSICLSLFLISITLLGCEEAIPEKEVIRSVRAIQVTDSSEFASRSFPGQAKATQEVDLSFRVAGPLITLPVKVGDTVRKGLELARIDPRDFEVDLRNAEGRLDRAVAELQRAEADYERVLRIQKEDPGAVSQSMVDRKRQVAESTGADIRSLQAEVDSASDRLRYTYLKAPFDGIVTATYVENYQVLKIKQPVLRLIDHSQIELIISIPENLISHADVLQDVDNPIRVRFDPFPDREIEAQIKEIGKEASKTTRTYPVTIIMDQPEDIKILPGMAGRAMRAIEIPGEATQAGVVIPETALFSPDDSGKDFVWVIDAQSKKAAKREVKTDELLDSGISIKEGLKPGEWIATAGVHSLKEGQEVRILSASKKEDSK
jgi:RND family efflux transporter MFP subunit